MNTEQKIEVARQLSRLGVDIIEAGFPAASPGDLDAVRRIATEVKGLTVLGLARTGFYDIDAAWEAVQHAEDAAIHTFISTSPIHIERKLRKTPDEVVEMARAAVRRCKGYVSKVEFSAEDATRSDWDYLCRIFGAAIEEGATTINIPDTVGYTMPAEYQALIEYVRGNTPGIADVVISVHCHNDLGMATANTLAAVQAGARQVEVTLNGIGERAGNTSLEEVVMALRTRHDIYGGLDTNIDATQLVPTSRLVSRMTGITVQPNKAIVGANAFAHEAGIHQDGMLKDRETYEIMTPQSVGLSGSQLTIGKLSGRRGLQQKLKDLGHEVEGEALDEVYRQAVALADAKKEVTDADLRALMEQRASEVPASVALIGWSVTSSHGGNATGTVTLTVDGEERSSDSTGNGPVNALFGAVDDALQPVLGWHPALSEYEIKAVSSGEDAQGQVLVRCRRSSDEGPGALVVTGHGLSTNIIEASLDAYLVAVNKLHGAEINGVAVAFVAPRVEEGMP
jgi:2-isopropylmalate synthase